MSCFFVVADLIFFINVFIVLSFYLLLNQLSYIDNWFCFVNEIIIFIFCYNFYIVAFIINITIEINNEIFKKIDKCFHICVCFKFTLQRYNIFKYMSSVFLFFFYFKRYVYNILVYNKLKLYMMKYINK
jgi:hypothetical protein